MSTNAENQSRERRSATEVLVRLWPSLPYMAFAVWTAWAFLAYSGAVWLSENESDGIWLTGLYVVSTLSFAVVCLVAPLFFATMKRLLSKRWFLVAAGGLAAVGAVFILAAGPFYANVRILFWIGSVFTGCGTAFIALKCGELFGVMNPRRALLYAALAQILAVGIYFVVVASPVWQPVGGGPGLTGMCAFVLLPLLAGYMVSLPARMADDDLRPEDDVFGDSRRERPANGGIRSVLAERKGKLPAAFWKMVVVVIVLSAVTSMVRSSVVTPGALATTLDGNSVVMYCRLVIMFSFIYLAVRATPDSFDFGRMYSLLTVAIVVSLALISMMGGINDPASILIYFLSSVFEFIVWCLLAFIVFQKRISPLLVFGFGRGAFMLGSGAGWLAGYMLTPLVEATIGVSMFYLCTAGITLILVVVVFSARDLDSLFSSEQVRLDDDGVLPVDADDDHSADRKGRFGSAVDAIAAEAGLSAREHEVLKLLAMGRGSDFIAQNLHVSQNTARTHTHNIYAKLGVHSRQEIIDRVDAAMRADKQM